MAHDDERLNVSGMDTAAYRHVMENPSAFDLARHFRDVDIDEHLARIRAQQAQGYENFSTDMARKEAGALLRAIDHIGSPVVYHATWAEYWATVAAVAFLAFTWAQYGFAEMAWAAAIGCAGMAFYHGVKYLIARVVAFSRRGSISEAADRAGSPPT